MEKENISFKCPNELKLTVKKEKETIIDEECCTILNIMLKNDGQLGTSFFGSHNPQIVKILESALKTYFKNLKKTFKSQYKQETKDEIKVIADEIPEDNKMQPGLTVDKSTEENTVEREEKDKKVANKPKKTSTKSKKQSATSKTIGNNTKIAKE